MAKDNQVLQSLYQIKKGSVRLSSPTALPMASGYLYNQNMLMQLNCRGYARAQFMQPEPAKYSHGPTLEAKTFIQPEQSFYKHHPGRFFYLKNKDTKQIASVPYEPCRVAPSKYMFDQQLDQIRWEVVYQQVKVTVVVQLANEYSAELWQVTLKNISKADANLSLYPCFSIGYQSWMYREAYYDETIQGVLAKSITPYQRLEDYYANQSLKDCTYLLAGTAPDYWQCDLTSFEGEGGLSSPAQIHAERLNNQAARYEDSIALMQYDLVLKAGSQKSYCFAFGPANNSDEIAQLRTAIFNGEQFRKGAAFSAQVKPVLKLQGDDEFQHFINDWLPNQVNYHGTLNRLTTDPQTRNYLQDAIGMNFIKPGHTRNVLLRSLSQQRKNGEMPDGILLSEAAELKYINQVPHADANIWLPITLLSYLNETNDTSILDELVPFADDELLTPVYQHVELALEYVLNQRDDRGLCLIYQGDWCDPMNMVGHKGKGVSSWLSLALAYAIKSWIEVIENYGGHLIQAVETLSRLNQLVEELNYTVNLYCWEGDWYARGITDDNKLFGVAEDVEGRIYLNPQSWALLSGAATVAKKYTLLNEVERQLNTPFGVMMLAPSYTSFREDVGRLTQKYPGTAENGSVYNHAAIFYAYALYQIGEYNQAYQVITKMLPSVKDIETRGQLPNFIPNYYRGAYFQFPSHAGRSSQMLNTGTVAWLYRCIVEELCGLKGGAGQLVVEPKLPDAIEHLSGQRNFMGANIEFSIEKHTGDSIKLTVNGQEITGNRITDIEKGASYQLKIKVPR
ncbi:NdvB protein [Thalassotalea sp. M1531]|uniref:NdvB protein n=1 Tax=Thalassotalea algicola TaxID=2716224 RepID=A0A7Y0LDB6_9GAMM|nr:NdvB protein [Thalassotalea algicola]NMP31516.1 NdvB protein [Thalassotalea algicola]